MNLAFHFLKKKRLPVGSLFFVGSENEELSLLVGGGYVL